MYRILHKTTAFIKHIINTKPWLVFIAPSCVGVALFLMIPYIDVIRRSFFSGGGNEFVGINNYIEIIGNEAFRLAVKNTSLFMLICIPILLILSLMIAVFLYNNTSIGKYLKTCFLIPMAVPVAAVVVIWKVLFDDSGIFNSMLNNIGFNGSDWMNTDMAFLILILSYIWKNIGYNIVLWMAGLSMISENIYEAARMDGANNRHIFIKITIPNLLPMIFIIVVMALINSFKVFREVYLVAGNYPHNSIYMIQHLFNNWFRDLSIDKMAAGAVLVSAVLIIFIVFLQKAWDSRS